MIWIILIIHEVYDISLSDFFASSQDNYALRFHDGACTKFDTVRVADHRQQTTHNIKINRQTTWFDKAACTALF